MAKLSKKFRFDKRNRASHRAAVPGSGSLPNAYADPPTASQQAVNAVTFSMTMPPLVPGNRGGEAGTSNILPPDSLANTERFLVTRVEDPRVQVVDDNGCAAANPSCQPGCTHEISDVTDALRAIEMQKWLDKTPGTEELVEARDEILQALSFDHEKERSDAEKKKCATKSAKAKEADGNASDSKPEDGSPTRKKRKNKAGYTRKRSLSSASSSTLSSIDTEYFYGCGYISPLDELEPISAQPSNVPVYIPPSAVAGKVISGHTVQGLIHGKSGDGPQAAIELSNGASNAVNPFVPVREPSSTSKLNLKFKGKPIFLSKPVPSTSGCPIQLTGDTDNRPKAHPTSLRSRSSMASIDQVVAGPGTSLKSDDGKLSGKFAEAHNFFKIGRSASSSSTTHPPPGSFSTDPDLSRAPTIFEPRTQLSSSPASSPCIQKPSIGGSVATHSCEELPIPPPSTPKLSYPTSDIAKARSDGELLADLRSGEVATAGNPNSKATTTSPPIAAEETVESSIKRCADLGNSSSGKGKPAEGDISSPATVSKKTRRGSKKHARSPLFDIRKKSSLTGLRIQLDFFNKMLGDIKKKIDKLIIFQPTPTILERLRQLKHAHRGIILTLGAATILEDMRAVGYSGKLLQDLEAFQARLDQYDWVQEGEDQLANPFGLPMEPAWSGPQFEQD